MARAAADPAWLQTFTQARKCLHGEAPKSFASLESVGCQHITGYKLTRQYDFLSDQEFQSKYKMRPQDLHMAADTIIDEHGRKTSGIIMANDSTRKLEVYSFVNLALTESMLKEENQIREHQGRDLRDLVATDLAKMRPKALRPMNLGGLQAPDHDKVMEMVKKHAAEKEALAAEAEMRRKAAEAGEPLLDPKVELPHQEKQSEESSSEFEEDTTGEILLPSMRAKAAKAKAKSKSSGKNKSKDSKAGGGRGSRGGSSLPSVLQDGRPLASAMPPPPQSIVSVGSKDLDVQSVRSGCTSTSRRAAGGVNDVETRIKDLQLSKVLARDPLGDRFYSVKRKIEELEAKEPGDAELVLLRAHQALAFVAKDYCRDGGGVVNGFS